MVAKVDEKVKSIYIYLYYLLFLYNELKKYGNYGNEAL